MIQRTCQFYEHMYIYTDIRQLIESSIGQSNGLRTISDLTSWPPTSSEQNHIRAWEICGTAWTEIPHAWRVQRIYCGQAPVFSWYEYHPDVRLAKESIRVLSWCLPQVSSRRWKPSRISRRCQSPNVTIMSSPRARPDIMLSLTSNRTGRRKLTVRSKRCTSWRCCSATATTSTYGYWTPVHFRNP